MDLLILEQQRLALETNLQKLRQSLKHWRTWDAEYEGLKEGIINANEDCTFSQLTQIAKTYGGDLVNEKETSELIGRDKDSPRSAKQIIGLIERRQEYVQKNIETVQRQFFEAEAKSEELTFAAANHGTDDEVGLPLTEIHEELDEEGNVISSRLSRPEEVTANVVESLRKAGLSEEDLGTTVNVKPKAEDLKPAITNASPLIVPSTTTQDKQVDSDTVAVGLCGEVLQDDLQRPPIRKKLVSFTADTKAATEPPRPESEDGRKSVSFAEKVAVMPAAPPPDTRSVSFSPQVEEIPPLGLVSPDVPPLTEEVVEKPRESMELSQEPMDVMEKAMTSDKAIIMPKGESPDDARLRQDMLDYHLNEVGSVVAQIELDEANMGIDQDLEDEDDHSSYYTTSEYLEDEDTPYTTGLSESEDSEDEFGRSKRRQLSPEYRKQMQELQERLIGNIGPAPEDGDITAADPNIDAKDVRKLVIRDKRNSTSSASSDNSEKKYGGKKRVSFAESLDVAEPGSPPLKAQKLQDTENVAPVADTISERTTATSHSLPEGTTSANVSRFKQARALPLTQPEDEPPSDTDTDMQDAAVIVDESPSYPSGVTIANTLTERNPRYKPASAPSAEDPDPIMQRRELAAEYYRKRNHMIRQQGGFKGATEDSKDDQDQGELMEERDGKLKKVSRFKAARIKS